MKVVWYDGSVEVVKQNRILQSFRDFILIPNEEDRKNNLDDLDEVLEDMDDLFEDKNMEYTTEIEKYLKTETKTILDNLKNESLKSLLKDVKAGLLGEFGLEDFPDDYKLKDVNNVSATEQLVRPVEDKEVLEKDYTLDLLGKRIRDALDEGDNLISFDEDKQKKGKIVFTLNMPSETPEEKSGKIGWYESQGIEVALHEPTFKRNPTESTKRIVEFDEDTRQEMLDYSTFLQIKDDYNMSNFKQDMIKLISEEKGNLTKYILNAIPMKVLDKTHLFDLNMDIEIMADKELPEEKQFEVDKRPLIDDMPNPNYGQFKLDVDGEKIPIYDADEIENLREMKITSKAKATRSIKPRPTKAVTFGTTERVRGTGKRGATAGKASEFKGGTINMARKYYLSFIKARLQELETAIKEIPSASAEV